MLHHNRKVTRLLGSAIPVQEFSKTKLFHSVVLPLFNCIYNVLVKFSLSLSLSHIIKVIVKQMKPIDKTIIWESCHDMAY